MKTRAKAASEKATSEPRRSDRYQPLHDPLRDRCSGRAAIDVMRGRWKASILYYLRQDPARFMELKKNLRGITDQTLTVQLRQMEADGVIERRRQLGYPPSVEYSLSKSGRELSRILQQLEAWGVGYLGRRAASDSQI